MAKCETTLPALTSLFFKINKMNFNQQIFLVFFHKKNGCINFLDTPIFLIQFHMQVISNKIMPNCAYYLKYV